MRKSQFNEFDKGFKEMFNNFTKLYFAIMITSFILGIGTIGFIAWVIIRILNHFGI